MEKQVCRFNRALVVVLILAVIVDIGLVWGFAYVLHHVKPLL